MAGEKIFYVEGFTCGGESHDALVMFSSRGAIELGAILETHWNTARAREVENLLYATAVLPAGDENAVKRMSGDERFFDSMKSREMVHLNVFLQRTAQIARAAFASRASHTFSSSRWWQ